MQGLKTVTHIEDGNVPLVNIANNRRSTHETKILNLMDQLDRNNVWKAKTTRQERVFQTRFELETGAKKLGIPLIFQGKTFYDVGLAAKELGIPV